MPRVNRAIELLEADQPVYYSGVPGGLTYQNGVAHRDTWADYLIVEFEHGAFNPVGLGEFMRGLVDAGTTKSGHRTPAVICTLPTDGTDENVMRANAWMVKQVLARGVHGILLCHAETPGAVRVFVESAPLSRPYGRCRGRRCLTGCACKWRDHACPGTQRRGRTGHGRGHLGPFTTGICPESRCLASESGRRASARPEDREPACAGECRSQRCRAGDRVRRVGTG